MIKQRITGRFFLVLTSIFLYSLVGVSSNALAFGSGGFGNQNDETCRQLEESNRINREMLKLQREQMEQQRIDNMMRNAEESLGHRRWN